MILQTDNAHQVLHFTIKYHPMALQPVAWVTSTCTTTHVRASHASPSHSPPTLITRTRESRKRAKLHQIRGARSRTSDRSLLRWDTVSEIDRPVG